MPTKNARVNAVLEKPLYAAVDEIVKRQGLSKPMVAIYRSSVSFTGKRSTGS